MREPSTTYEMLLSLLGEKGTINMCEAYGGHTIRIPKDFHGDGLKDIWHTRFGEEGTAKMCAHFGGDRLYIPKNKAGEIEARNTRIVSRLRDGFSVCQVAEEFQLSERQVYVIFGKARSANSVSDEPTST